MRRLGSVDVPQVGLVCTASSCWRLLLAGWGAGARWQLADTCSCRRLFDGLLLGGWLPQEVFHELMKAGNKS